MHSKQELYSFMRRACKFIKNHPGHIDLAKIKKREKYRKRYYEIAGTYCPDTERIVIDYRTPILSVLIHEMIHAFHPEWRERKVVIEERALTNQLSRCQMRKLFRMMAVSV